MRETAIWFAGAVWLGAVATGVAVWDRYENAAGAAGSASVTVVEPAAGQWRLIAFVHPHCPCARTMFAELESLHRAEPAMRVRIVFVRPAEAEAGWERGASWNAASNIPGIEVAIDVHGAEAKRFGAETSGQAVLIRPDGRIVFRIVFRGGLTRGRAKAGDSPGRNAIRDWLAGGSGLHETSVYGCPLFTPAE